MNKKLSLLDRVTLPTPRFFRKVRSVSAAVGAVGAVLVASPALLPAGVVALGGYLVLAGSVGAAVASVAVETGTQEDAARERRELDGASGETL